MIAEVRFGEAVPTQSRERHQHLAGKNIYALSTSNVLRRQVGCMKAQAVTVPNISGLGAITKI